MEQKLFRIPPHSLPVSRDALAYRFSSCSFLFVYENDAAFLFSAITA